MLRRDSGVELFAKFDTREVVDGCLKILRNRVESLRVRLCDAHGEPAKGGGDRARRLSFGGIS